MPRETVEILGRNWHHALTDLVRAARRSLVVCSPFVGADGTALIQQNLGASFLRGDAELVFLTSLTVDHMLCKATDPAAIMTLAQNVKSSRVVHLPGLHAKVYIADDDLAIVTSANLTAGGIYRNYECGVLLSASTAVERMRTDLLALLELGANVPNERLAVFAEIIAEISEDYKAQLRHNQVNLAEQFKGATASLEDDLLRLRLSSGPIHTVFARSIEYFLRRDGSLTTEELHARISSLHPDLCDNSVDRVIGGKRFGKKWKHAVRTAQQQLKKKGVVLYADGVWQYIGHGD